MSSFFFFFFIFFFLTSFKASAQENPIYVYCQNTTTLSTTYLTNIPTLLSSLSSDNSSYSTGFENATFGQAPDSVTGLLLCRGDVSPEVCRTCADNAVKATLNRCPNGTDVMVYYDHCTLRYSNRNILSTLITNRRIVMANYQNVTSNQKDRFKDLVRSTMLQAANYAAYNSSRKFDARKVPLPSFETLYALVQCTPDLTGQDCLSCLQQIIYQLPTDKIGGRYIVPSCSSRYEQYLFYNDSAIITPPPPPPPSPQLVATTLSHPQGSGQSSVSFSCFQIAGKICRYKDQHFTSQKWFLL